MGAKEQHSIIDAGSPRIRRRTRGRKAGFNPQFLSLPKTRKETCSEEHEMFSFLCQSTIPADHFKAKPESLGLPGLYQSSLPINCTWEFTPTQMTAVTDCSRILPFLFTRFTLYIQTQTIFTDLCFQACWGYKHHCISVSSFVPSTYVSHKEWQPDQQLMDTGLCGCPAN